MMLVIPPLLSDRQQRDSKSSLQRQKLLQEKPNVNSEVANLWDCEEGRLFSTGLMTIVGEIAIVTIGFNHRLVHYDTG